MHKGLPSVTAMIVAAARVLASTTRAAECDPGDRLARTLLPLPIDRALRALERSERVAPWLPRAVSLVSIGMVDHLALRTRAIDHALDAALAMGIDQLVILGAGLDTRAHRMPALCHTHVFEVDHPDSQAHKRLRATHLPRLAKDLTYVPMDFVHDSLEAQLVAHGHDATRASFWLWEGVVPYLDRSAIRSTLQAVARRSTAGSQLATTYVTGAMTRMRHAKVTMSLGMRTIGEPVRALIEPEEWQRLLVEHGFSLLSDSDTRQWRAEFADRRLRGAHIAYERLAIATRA